MKDTNETIDKNVIQFFIQHMDEIQHPVFNRSNAKSI